MSLVAGSGELFIVIAKELRDKIGKQAGDVVKMTFGLDTSNSAIKVPADLKKALSMNEKAKTSFERMARRTRRPTSNGLLKQRPLKRGRTGSGERFNRCRSERP